MAEKKQEGEGGLVELPPPQSVRVTRTFRGWMVFSSFFCRLISNIIFKQNEKKNLLKIECLIRVDHRVALPLTLCKAYWTRNQYFKDLRNRIIITY